MAFFRLFGKKKESLLGLDIGSSGVKLVGFNFSTATPRLIHLGFAPIKGDIFNNNVISHASKVTQAIESLIQAYNIAGKKVTTAIPGPSVFTKKIKMPLMSLKELDTNIQFEASNLIPHNINAVRLDYHILGETGKKQIDVLVVAAKNEIIDSFVAAIQSAGLTVGIVDVDGFALQNMFELNYPELHDKTVALVNMGARYSSINICKGGKSLFIGDISVGGKYFTDSLCEVFSLDFETAENLKIKRDEKDPLFEAAVDIQKKNIEHVGSEFNRQLSFFWNASGSDEGIDYIFLCGGGACTTGLIEEMSEKTGIECQLIDPFRAVEIPDEYDLEYVKSLAPLMGISVGLAVRQTFDKIIPSFM